MKVEPYWDAQKFSLLSWLFIANGYCTDSGLLFCRTELSHGRKKQCLQMLHKFAQKRFFLVPTILLSISVEQKLAFHKVVQYLIRSTCLQGPRRV